MAKQPEVIWEHILPSGRGVRFVRCSTKLMLGITERAMETVVEPGAPMNQAKLATKVQEETVASCVRGVTTVALKPICVDARAATDDEKAKGQKPPQKVDIEATLAQYRPAAAGQPENPSARVWKSLGYSTLIADGDDNMYELFDDPVEWRAVLERISGARIAAGGASSDPFAGQPSTRSG